jgi:AraC-like DNA-binding protein/mannose-6-phosphate isomerase-like protein (cupin superfamily)
MALQKCGLNLNHQSKELQPHGSLAFPCAGYESHHSEQKKEEIPWHWHEELEIICLKSGQMIFRIPQKSFLMKEGDFLIINSGILHYAEAAPEGTLQSLVFSPALITGREDTVFSRKYIAPLLAAPSFTACYISRENAERIAEYFDDAFHSLAEEQFGYEFTVRENLSKICLFLYRSYAIGNESRTRPVNSDNLRLKKMLEIVETRYAENISLDDIARAADISARECLRCFKRTMQLSPFQYLMKYRMMRGAEMLMGDPEIKISEVSLRCGFDSPSNFTSTFRRFYKCTPRDYRRQYSNKNSGNGSIQNR